MYEDKGDRDFSLWMFGVVAVIALISVIAEVALGYLEWALFLGAVGIVPVGIALKAAFRIAITFDGRDKPRNAFKIGPFRIWRQTFS